MCPDDFSKSGISAMNPGCKATADRSLISAAFAVLPAVMAKKASPNAIVAETLRMLRRFIVFSSDHRLRDARCQRAHTWNAGAEALARTTKVIFGSRSCPPAAPALPIIRNEKFGTFSF